MRKFKLMAKFPRSSIIAPVILIAFYVLFALILRIILPSGKDLIDYLSSVYGRFGYEIIIVGSFLEALLLINMFTPGVVAIGLGVVFAKAGELDLTLAIVFAVTGALVGFMLDFLLGKFGFAQILERIGYGGIIQQTKSKLEKFSFQTFSLGFMHPNLGSLVSFAAGALKMDFKKFFLLALLSTLVWYILWGLLIFILGGVFLTILTKYTYIIFLLVGTIWLLSTIYNSSSKR